MMSWANISFAELFFVRSVSDGVTLKSIEGEALQLKGIHIPAEKVAEAKAFVKGLVSGSVVSLEYDTSEVAQQENLQGYVWFKYDPPRGALTVPENYEVRLVVDEEGHKTGDVMVLLNATLIKSGLAVPTDSLSGGKYIDLFQKIYSDYKLTEPEILANIR